MMTIKDFAKKKKISLKAARSRLDRQVEAGVMAKKRGPSNMFLYYDAVPVTYKWHDPFNLIGRRAT